MTLEEQILRHEGLRLQMYYDTCGVPTIGVGRNLRVGISHDEALYLLRNDLRAVQAALHYHLPWFIRLTEIRQRVLSDLAFNLGMAGLLKFTKMLGHIEREEYVAAAEQLLKSKYAAQVGARAVRLSFMLRTNQEADWS